MIFLVIGIPRGLYYFKYKTFWKAFFSQLGINIIFSAPTNQNILDNGISSCVSEACMPLKAYMGHVLNLKDRVDVLYIPRFTSVSQREYICPKFGGLPNMVRSTISELPVILDPEVNMYKNKKESFNAHMIIGQKLGINKQKIRDAFEVARSTYRQDRLENLGIPLSDDKDSNNKENKLNILLMGHVYTVYDRFLNLDLVKKIQQFDTQVWTLDAFDSRALKISSRKLNKPMFWNYGTKALGCAYELINRNTMDGVIYLTCFGCGIDSFVGYMVERRIRHHGIPFTTISLDEHTGKAGMDTRVEAFIDTISRRKEYESGVPTHGQCIYSYQSISR